MSNTSPISSTPKVFGFWTATALVIGNMIGSGIFFLPTSLAQFGPISILGWVVTATGAMCLAYVFALLTRSYPKAGGPYTHAQHAFGDIFGFLMAWGYWTMSWSSNAAISMAFVSYLSHFIPMFADNTLLAIGLSIGLVWLTTIINCFGIQYGGFVQVITVIVKISPLFVVGILGWFYIDPSNFFPLNVSGQSNFSAINAAAALTMWAFIGLEAATVPADNVSNPSRTIARATLFGTAVGALLYIVTSLVIFGLIPTDQLAGSNAPFVIAAMKVLGPYAGPIIGLCVLCSIFGGLNGWILVQGQIPYSLAKENMFPKIFLKTSKNGTPVVGLIVSSLLITGIMLMNLQSSFVDKFNTIILVGAVMTLIAYIFAALASLKLLKDNNGLVAAALIGIAYAFVTIYGAGIEILNVCVVGYALGIPVYMFSKRAQQTPAFGGVKPVEDEAA
jgi:APA family basic amino acid/polyamine antiporter